MTLHSSDLTEIYLLQTILKILNSKDWMLACIHENLNIDPNLEFLTFKKC